MVQYQTKKHLHGKGKNCKNGKATYEMLPCSFIRRNSETWEQIIIFKTIFYMHTYVSIYICVSLSLSLSFWFRCIYIYSHPHVQNSSYAPWCEYVLLWQEDPDCFKDIFVDFPPAPPAYKKRATWAFPRSLMVKTQSFQHKGYYWFWFSCSYTSKW